MPGLVLVLTAKDISCPWDPLTHQTLFLLPASSIFKIITYMIPNNQ